MICGTARGFGPSRGLEEAWSAWLEVGPVSLMLVVGAARGVSFLMLVCCAKGDNLLAEIDWRFGRCASFQDPGFSS